MAVGEREPVTREADLLFLRSMKGVKEVFGTLDLKKLVEATSEDQRRIVGEALEKARKGYDLLGYRDKLDELEQVRTAYEEGRLTLPGLLQGLELRPKSGSDHQSPWDQLKGFLEKVKSSRPFSKSKPKNS